MRLKRFWHNEEKDISDLLIGRSVKKVADDKLLLDDGTILKVIPNDGGCSCGAGDYELTELNDCGNVITNVEFSNDVIDYEEYCSDQHVYRLFVFAENKKIPLFTVEGDDGNGYYGTGYSIEVVVDDE